MYVSAIVVAAGKGKRLKSRIPKPLIKLGGKPIIIYSLRVLSVHPSIKEIIVVTNSLSMRQLTVAIKQYKINKVKAVVLGGPQRQDSVYNGLRLVSARADLVLIHDGVRPFIDAKVLSSLIKAAKSYGAAIAGIPVKATIKKVSASSIVEKTIDRENLREIQTPQVFKRDLIESAYRKFGNVKVTDEAMLIEKMGRQVNVVSGPAHNIKITTPEDLAVAEAILKWKTE